MTIPDTDGLTATAPVASAPVVAPPTKKSSQENFPVGSWLLPRKLRPHIAAFYRFARASDDIADSPDIPMDGKLAGLAQMDRALDAGGDDRVDPVRASILQTGVGLGECRDLLVAFRRDSENRSCRTWDDLLDYCRYSAHPVGRYLLLLHGEDEATIAPGDALCAAFQVLNHVQDCGDDWRNLKRLYVPSDWIEAAGGTAKFLDPAQETLRRPVLDRCLDGVEALLEVATRLPGMLRSKGLKAEVAVMLSLAYRLTERLRARDPVRRRVKLGKLDFLRALRPGLRVLLGGKVRVRRDADIVRESVMRSGSSFAAGMRILRKARRRGMYALYGFCRAVDDIADAPAPVEEKRASLMDWARRLDRIYAGETIYALDRELADAIRRYDLPREEFDLILEGMAIDAAPSVRMADRAALAAYARRVAGAVGVLSARIFGAKSPASKGYAIALGETLQLTNIMRDIDEDAALDRLYVPLELLARTGIALDRPAQQIVADRGFPNACEMMAMEIDDGYRRISDLLPPEDRGAFLPARIMQAAYQRIYLKLKLRGWHRRGGPRPRLTRRERLLTILAALKR